MYGGGSGWLCLTLILTDCTVYGGGSGWLCLTLILTDCTVYGGGSRWFCSSIDNGFEYLGVFGDM